MRILITGASGAVGRHLLKTSISEHHEIACLVRNNNSFADNNIQLIKFTDTLPKRVIEKFNPEAVIHLAGYTTSSTDANSISQLIEGNILFGTKILKAIENSNVTTFINFSTATLYNNEGEIEPNYLYSSTKLAFYNIIRFFQKRKNYKVINCIPYNIYGFENSKRGVISLLMQSLTAKEKVLLSPGEQQLDFIHIDDITSFVNNLIQNLEQVKELWTDAFLGSGSGTSIKEVGQIIENKSTKKLNVVWGGIPYRENDTMHSVAPLVRNKLPFDWSCNILLDAGIKKMLEAKGLVSPGK